MAIAIGDVLRFKVFQRFLGQQVLNVQHYRIVQGSQTAVTLKGFAEPLALKWFQEFRPVQSGFVNYVRAELSEAAGILFDEYQYGVGQTGQVTGDPLPPFAAYGIRQVRATKLVRNGQKRIAGVPETFTSGGELTSAARGAVFVAADEMFRSEFIAQDPLDPQRFIVLQPIIYGGEGTTPFNPRFSDITGVIVNNFVTTQNTRKVRTVEGV